MNLLLLQLNSMRKYVLQNGADVNASAVGGVTPLHIAAEHGDERMVDCLLAAGANADAVDEVCGIMSMCVRCFVLSSQLPILFKT